MNGLLFVLLNYPWNQGEIRQKDGFLSFDESVSTFRSLSCFEPSPENNHFYFEQWENLNIYDVSD